MPCIRSSTTPVAPECAKAATPVVPIAMAVIHIFMFKLVIPVN
jgi:hypothetical protein